MSSDMVPMNMGGNGGNGFVRQLFYLFGNVADAKPGVNQQASTVSVQKVTVCFFPMPVFADDVCIRVDAVYGKPITH